MRITIVTILLVAIVGPALALKKADCPPKEAIRLCTCTIDGLNCKGFFGVAELVDLFKKVAGYTFRDVQIESSILDHIPHDLFENVTVENLYIIRTTFLDLFDAPPTALSTLKQLYIIESKIFGKKWNYLTSISSLIALYIDGTEVEVLDKTFGSYLPKSLEYLSINGTKIKSFKQGAFEGLTNLKGLFITEAGLTNLNRNMFPTPFNTEYLLLSGNKLTSIPDDLFTHMPKLSIVDLSKNGLTTIPEQAFDGRASQLDFLILDDNSMNCDCGLEWLVKNKPSLVSGVCKNPAELKGKSLFELTEDDFHC